MPMVDVAANIVIARDSAISDLLAGFTLGAVDARGGERRARR